MNEKGLIHYKANNFALAETYFTKALNWKKNYADA
jgi:Tfp pilus assembly protein PilF